MPSLAVVAFPGNNCEKESQRAAERNGFSAEILKWNQIEEIGKFDAYLLPGGFSFEDRGRSGAIAAREKIFDALRAEARKGKLILGICNGAQMVVESGLIPIGKNPLPFALAHNIRRDHAGHVIGTGFYNDWVHLKVERTDTAFTQNITEPIRVPIAHGEGRFATIDTGAEESLKNGENVAFRYCDETGNVKEDFPITPNGALSATAAIVNAEGTVCAIMPHPERFPKSFSGDKIFQSMKQWIEAKKSPEKVEIGDFSQLEKPAVKAFEKAPKAVYLEKKLIITDNENFSVRSAIETFLDKNIALEKTVLFEIIGDNLDIKALEETGLFYNPNKEFLVKTDALGAQKFAVKDFQNDEADHLAEQLSVLLSQKITVKIYKTWDFGDTDAELVDRTLQNRILCNPNSSEIFRLM